jgi:uncharacterized repeat protein (TIGR02543 family)
MRKRKFSLLGVLALALTFTLLFAGCPNPAGDGGDDDNDSPATYTVSFNVDGGSSVSNQSVTSGGKADEPTAPTKAGYTFGGWYKESNFTNQWNFGTDTVTGNITIYAKWTVVEGNHEVTFNTNGGSSVSNQSVTPGGKATEPTAPTKAGYTFAGWYKESDFTNQWDFGTDTVSAATTLYARWTPNGASTLKITDTPPEMASASSVQIGIFPEGETPEETNVVAMTTSKNEGFDYSGTTLTAWLYGESESWWAGEGQFDIYLLIEVADDKDVAYKTKEAVTFTSGSAEVSYSDFEELSDDDVKPVKPDTPSSFTIADIPLALLSDKVDIVINAENTWGGDVRDCVAWAGFVETAISDQSVASIAVWLYDGLDSLWADSDDFYIYLVIGTNYYKTKLPVTFTDGVAEGPPLSAAEDDGDFEPYNP